MKTVAERLRRGPGDWQNPEQALLNEAAAAIERLEAERERYRAALAAADEMRETCCGWREGWNEQANDAARSVRRAYDAARAAIAAMTKREG